MKEDRSVVVTLYEGIVKKTVRGFGRSRLSWIVSPEEMVDREIRALEMLEGVYNVQRFVKREDDDTFYTRHVPGTSLKNFKRSLDREYFERLEEIVIKCQEKGVYRIGQNRDDFIVGPNETPRVIDFGNIIFADDKITKFPGVLNLARKYSDLRLADLRRRYVSNDKNISGGIPVLVENYI